MRALFADALEDDPDNREIEDKYLSTLTALDEAEAEMAALSMPEPMTDADGNLYPFPLDELEKWRQKYLSELADKDLPDDVRQAWLAVLEEAETEIAAMKQRLPSTIVFWNPMEPKP
jgi:hypothetical protein